MDNKNKYNPNKHNRKSIRLKDYDYSQPGLYFITICCENKNNLFGKIENEVMILNNIGKIANIFWLDIPKHFPNTVLHEHIIMPNHIHGIIELVEIDKYSQENDFSHQRAKDFSPLQSPSKTIGSIVRGFKIGVTKWVRKNTNIHNVWQRNYYEHIIRNNTSYQTITEYIINNPRNWENDKFFIK